MADQVKEILGFLARWFVLGLALTSVVLTALMAVSAAAITFGSGRADAYISDAIWQTRSGQKSYVRGQLDDLALGNGLAAPLLLLRHRLDPCGVPVVGPRL